MYILENYQGPTVGKQRSTRDMRVGEEMMGTKGWREWVDRVRRESRGGGRINQNIKKPDRHFVS